MATNKLLWSSKLIGVFFIMLVCTLSANAQFLRTSYFMEGTHYRQQLNPALTPTKGYFNLPVIGAVNATVGSTSLGYQDIIDIIDDGDDFYTKPDFMNRLKDNNKLNVNFSTEILSAGWYKGKNFWSFNIGLRTDIGANLTKNMFTFLNEMETVEENWRNSNYDISGQQLNINAYTEIGLGLSRQINSRLTVGARVKALLGIGNMELKLNRVAMSANLPSDQQINQWSSESYWNSMPPPPAASKTLAYESKLFDVRKLAAFTKAKNETFFILCGWMENKEADLLKKELEEDPDIFCTLEENPDRRVSIPPTRLKNPKLIKPFEMFIQMYGLPNYQEFDPTLFVALSYSIIFGAMFGDAGQGLVLLIGGYLLYHFKKINLAAVLSSCGFFSTIFGLLYGSVFGFEDWIPALWLRPTEAMTNLPVIGTLNTVFVVTITIGMGLILLTMIFHMINSLREKKPGEALFDTNGLAGFVFYGAVVAVIMLFMTGHTIPAAGVLVVMFVVPLLVIVCKEPLSALVEKKKYQDENGPVMFVVQGFFELFEVCLSYFSNTLSFVRIGAFAVSHAAMMQVVMMLAGAENGQAPNVIVVIVGNLVVMGMEGLIVGIQVLRLQYYEFFSRFYKGDGRKFEPYLSKEENI